MSHGDPPPNQHDEQFSHPPPQSMESRMICSRSSFVVSLIRIDFIGNILPFIHGYRIQYDSFFRVSPALFCPHPLSHSCHTSFCPETQRGEVSACDPLSDSECPVLFFLFVSSSFSRAFFCPAIAASRLFLYITSPERTIS